MSGFNPIYQIFTSLAPVAISSLPPAISSQQVATQFSLYQTEHTFDNPRTKTVWVGFQNEIHSQTTSC